MNKKLNKKNKSMSSHSIRSAVCIGGSMLVAQWVMYERLYRHTSLHGSIIILLATLMQSLYGSFTETPVACTTVLGKMAYFTYNNLLIVNLIYDPAVMYLARLTSTVTAVMYVLCVLPYEDDISFINIIAHILPCYATMVHDRDLVGVRDTRLLCGFFAYYLSVLVYVKHKTGEYPYSFIKRFNALQLFTFGCIIGIFFDSLLQT